MAELCTLQYPRQFPWRLTLAPAVESARPGRDCGAGPHDPHDPHDPIDKSIGDRPAGF